MTAVVLAPECMMQLVDMFEERMRRAASPTPVRGGEMLRSDQVMERLGYKDKAAFFAAARAAGCPMVKVNARKFLFEAAAVDAWVARRSGTHNPMQVIIECGPAKIRRAKV